MWVLVKQTDGLLRAEGLGEDRHSAEGIERLLALLCLCGSAYGMVMGCFGGWSGDRIWQVLYSAAKVPLLLLGTFLICLPSFFILNTVAGVRSDFGRALRALLATQAAMTVILCSFAPFTALWYLTSANYHSAVLFNGMVFAVSSLAAQVILRRLYRHLIQRSRKHANLLRIWLVSYVFVGIQLGWLLRPFVGQPSSAVELFRQNAWGNAYLEILHHLAGVIAR